VNGTPILIRNGQIIDFRAEKRPEHFTYDRHPRTAIGLKPNGHWLFVVVDGRNPTFSVGMSIPELAAFLASLGCVEAINLDGGGSSTLIIQGEVINHPTGDEDGALETAQERLVSDAIVICNAMSTAD
jgi:exopolysaccharide biosynthesis protein